MEIIFVVTALAFASVLILLVLLAAAGISAAFGASFHAVFVNGLWALLTGIGSSRYPTCTCVRSGTGRKCCRG